MLVGILARPRAVLLALVLASCGGGSETAAPPDAAADARPPSDSQQADAAPEKDTGAPLAPDAAVADASVEETGTFELPRHPAEPSLTRKLFEGGAALVGGDAGCSRAPAGRETATDDRWCAFSRAGADGGTELWVMNVSKLIAGAAPACDGSGDGCLRLTGSLWTGMPIWGVSHPAAHRFEGDTLFFYAGASSTADQIYDGPVWAWRPGWPAARAITSDHALLCYPDPRTAAVLCIDHPVIEKTGPGLFDRPILHAFDLTAGTLDGPAGGPLPVVATIRNAGSDLAWRARFSPDGASLAFSSVAAAGSTEALYVIALADIGRAAPTMIAPDVAEWEISRDGSKVYFLTGYDRARGDAAQGTLMLADFPSGAHPTPLHEIVRWYRLLGSERERPGIDRGALVAYAGASDLTSYAILRDRTHPEDRFLLGSRVDSVQPAADGRHTLYFQEVRGGDFPVAYVAHNDGTGACRLTSDYRAESYGSAFSDSSRAVFWIEFGRNQSESEEGWYARPESCGDKTKFGDFVAWYTLLDDDFVIFEGGDLADSTTWLEYSPLRVRADQPVPSPAIIVEHPDPALGVVRTAAGTWLLFTVSRAEPADAAKLGMFLHGPLRPLP
jgi:hypothetical protein